MPGFTDDPAAVPAMSGIYSDVYHDLYGAMPLRRMWDAAWPPISPPKWEVAAGYIGGNTPHPWTDPEWAAQRTRWRLPIFTRSTGGDPNADAAAAVAWLRAHGVPPGSTLALDFETRIDAAYLQTFDWVVEQAGYLTMVYGTRRTVLQNPKPSGGYWTAHWTNTPHLCSDPGVAATQYGGDVTLGQPYDASLIADTTPLWDTQGALILDTETKAYLDGKFADVLTKIQNGVLILMRGDETTDPAKDTHPDSIQRTRQDLAAARDALTEQLGVLAQAVQRVVDPAAVAALVAGQLEIVGIATDTGGVITVTFGPKTA